jgi:serine protease Do
MKKHLIIYVGIILIPLQFNLAQTADPFTVTTQKVLPTIVKIFAETNLEHASDMTAEVTKDTSNKLYSTGTGFFVSQDGYILTANHVIGISTGKIIIIHIENNTPTEYPATIVSSDSIADIALLKINKTNCPFLELLDPINLLVGVEVGFVGYPLNYFFPVVSKSILSAKVDLPIRDGLPTRHQLVINQFVNHGNSGGPVFLSITGQVVGIVSWRPSPNIAERTIVLPKNYQPVARIGGVDPIGLSVETYNENLKYIGELTQFGLGFVPSIEYAIPMLRK